MTRINLNSMLYYCVGFFTFQNKGELCVLKKWQSFSKKRQYTLLGLALAVGLLVGLSKGFILYTGILIYSYGGAMWMMEHFNITF